MAVFSVYVMPARGNARGAGGTSANTHESRLIHHAMSGGRGALFERRLDAVLSDLAPGSTGPGALRLQGGRARLPAPAVGRHPQQQAGQHLVLLWRELVDEQPAQGAGVG